MNSRLIWGVVVLPVVGVTAVLIAVQPPAWILLLLGSLALAVLYIVARRNSRYDPLDPRFGSCIPPISKPRDQ
jgi:drug/metabolite transporter (DMT)-like permease